MVRCTYQIHGALPPVAVGADASEVEGFAFFTDAPACAARARKTGGGSREAADAWFERV